MEILVGKTSGFCYGVKRAVEGAINEASKNEESVYCLGELVHNKQVIEKLENLGIKFIEKIEEAQGPTMIRAHGVAKEVYEKAKQKNIQIQDYTCPNVLKIHDIVNQFNNDGYFILLLGNKNHPENIGTLSYCKNYYVIENEEEALNAIKIIKEKKIDKLLLIAQTTYSLEKFNKIEKILQTGIPKNVTFISKNTICNATMLRQKETEKLSKQVDKMIIIGGKHSSNTKKLYEVSKKNCENTVLIETVKELDRVDDKFQKIGIMAGASTPQESIDEVIMFYKKKHY